MSTQDILLNIHTRLENFTSKDIKNLIQQQGKAKEGDKEFILKEPISTDPNLQAIIHHPSLEIKPIGHQNKSGEMYYDLRADGKMVRVKVVCHKLKEEKEEKKVN